MRQVLRRILRVDQFGRLLAVTVERLTDYENGTVEEQQATLVACCAACDRPLGKPDETRPACVHCGRLTCVACHGRCVVCRRSLCDRCRVGFAEKGLTVCDECLTDLQRRLERADRQNDEKVALDRQLTICSAQMKPLQLIMHSGGTVSQLVTEIVQARLARKLGHIERQIAEESDHGQQLR